MGVKVIDRGYRKLVDVFASLGERPTKISVGIHAADGGEVHEGDGSNALTVAQIGLIHEFGAPAAGIPQRSFIRAWADENQGNVKKAISAMLQSVVRGKRTREQAFQLLGQAFTGQVKKRMAIGIPPPLSPVTIALKGSSKPLIDSGQLRSSISYAVDGKLKPSEEK